jgi:hypothetical protein
MLRLLRKAYPPDSTKLSGPEDIQGMFWKLENTAAEGDGAKNHEWWGFSKCNVCGRLAILFSEATGYRCEDHR